MGEKHDVIVVGAGPVGLMTARMLGLAGHDVLVVERWPEPYPLPRAVHFDHEIGRLWQSAGLADEVRAVSERVPDQYEWRNAAGEALVKIDWSQDGPSGWPVASFFSQPELEAVLARAVEAMPNVRVMRGVEAVSLQEHDDRVDVTVTGVTLKHRLLSGRYVVGCDGANSFVRQHMSTSLTDLGFYYDWLIVDVIPHDDQEWSPMNWQLCDPARPTTVVAGGPGRRRWEFLRLPEENRDDLDTPETAWRLLEPWGRTPANTTLERHAVYTFQARWADVWNQGRLLLAGDAAHLMPPFAGQGMCSGIRDATNLAWKLDRVLRGTSEPELLDTYTTERRDHLQHAISMSVALGRTICVLDPDEARERDARMIAGGADPRTVLPPMPPERLGAGAWDDDVTPESVRATLAPQFTVLADGAPTLLDDVLADGMDGDTRAALVLLGFETDPRAGLDASAQAELDALGVRTVILVDADTSAPPVGAHEVVDGSARAYFTERGITTLLVRPDFYVYGAAADVDGTASLVVRLAGELAPAANRVVAS